MKRTEEIINRVSPIDKRCKLNRSSKAVQRSILDTIDKGITLEELDKFAAQGLPIKRYHTQVTIHGKFPEVGPGYVFGYKSIVKNGNGSIGVKYVAIDEEKRQRMKPYMSLAGFAYSHNSTQQTFTRSKRTDKETFEADKAAFKALADKVDESLFIGSVSMYLASIWGCTYICLDVTISAIYEKNIRPFLDKLGATEERMAAHVAEKEAKKRADEAEQEARDKEREAATQANIDKFRPDTEKIRQRYGEMRQFHKSAEGTFILMAVDHNGARFRVTHRAKASKAAKLPHVLTESFDNADDAIRFALSQQSISSEWRKESINYGIDTFKGVQIK